MAGTGRYILDCRKSPQGNCSLAISGTEQEVLDLGVYHAESKHGMKNTPETREQLRSFLKQEAYAS